MSFGKPAESYFFDYSPEALGARIAAVRIQQKLTQAETAKTLGVSHRSYQHYEKGTKACPTPTLAKLSQNFNVDLNWLVHGIESVSTADDASDLTGFKVALENYLTTAGISLPEHKKKAIAGCWYQYRSTRLENTQYNIVFWVDLMR